MAVAAMEVAVAVGDVAVEVVVVAAAARIYSGMWGWGRPASLAFTSKYTTSEGNPMVGISPRRNRFVSLYSARAFKAFLDIRR